jgi:hypothetical protein
MGDAAKHKHAAASADAKHAAKGKPAGKEKLAPAKRPGKHRTAAPRPKTASSAKKRSGRK